VPTYEYACTACGERLEAKQGFDDPPLEECPKCGGRLRKLFSPVGIFFRGSGFDSTDAKKKTTTGPPSTSDKESKSTDKADKKDKKPPPATGSSEKSA
jgi:putative FmdB family regulatory protein